ncbi:MAG: AIR synthase family protein [Bacillota bacterium]|nr:AIR synthase family protein [Bacillota bacterium]
MKSGKLDSRLLEEMVFKNIRYRRPDVLTRPGVGEDCAVVDYGAYECVLSTDPITGAARDIGRLAVHISCNDIAANGVEPLGILLAVMLPEGTDIEDVDEIMRQAGEVSEALGVEIIGGHTEITAAVNKPVIVSTAVGKALKGASQQARDMEPGDYILMTKKAGIEGTGIIACDCKEKLRGLLTEEELAEAEAMLEQVSVVREGVIAGGVGTAGMHDITEGGILGAVWEMCEIAGTGALVWEDSIPVAPVTEKICRHFGVNWLRLISSGSMLIMAKPDKKDAIMEEIAAAGIEIACIGRVLPLSEGRTLESVRGRETIEPPGSDEIYKVLFPS